MMMALDWLGTMVRGWTSLPTIDGRETTMYHFTEAETAAGNGYRHR
jgi:hypothetical protein